MLEVQVSFASKRAKGTMVIFFGFDWPMKPNARIIIVYQSLLTVTRYGVI